MGREKGFIKLYRDVCENPLWTAEPFSRGQAWVDLLMLANYKPSFFYKRDIKIDVPRGCVAKSVLELSDRWKWSRTKVSKYLADLEKEQQIRHQKTNITTLIYIEKYEDYQGVDAAASTPENQQESSSDAAGKQQESTSKESKEKKEGKKREEKYKLSGKLDFSSWPTVDQDLIEEYLAKKKQNKGTISQRVINTIGPKLYELEQLGVSAEKSILTALDSPWSGFEVGWVTNKLGMNGNDYKGKQPPKTVDQIMSELDIESDYIDGEVTSGTERLPNR